MRVIAGAAKGRRLRAPRSDRTRPTSDRVREALFSSLQDRLPGARVLDLYAGSGSLGLEAASRGAASVTFVEHAHDTAEVLRHNVTLVAEVVVADLRVVVAPVDRALRQALPGAPFDLVLVDPPYALPGEELAVVLRALPGVVVADGLVVVERSRRDAPPDWPAQLRHSGTRRYGDTTLYRAERDPTAPDGARAAGR